MSLPTDTIDDCQIDAATKAHEEDTRDIEMERETLMWLLVTHCIPEKELDIVIKTEVDDETPNSTERGLMALDKLQLFSDVLYGVEDDYKIPAKYYLCYCAARGLFKWIEGRRLWKLMGRRTQNDMRHANVHQLKALVSAMVADLQELRPPALPECTTRLAIPGRSCGEIAQVIAVSTQTVGDVLTHVAEKKKNLTDCWTFWREERAE